MDALEIDAWHLATHERMRTAVPVARVLARDATYALSHVPMLHTTPQTWAIMHTGATDVAQRATATE